MMPHRADSGGGAAGAGGGGGRKSVSSWFKPSTVPAAVPPQPTFMPRPPPVPQPVYSTAHSTAAAAAASVSRGGKSTDNRSASGSGSGSGVSRVYTDHVVTALSDYYDAIGDGDSGASGSDDGDGDDNRQSGSNSEDDDSSPIIESSNRHRLTAYDDTSADRHSRPHHSASPPRRQPYVLRPPQSIAPSRQPVSITVLRPNPTAADGSGRQPHRTLQPVRSQRTIWVADDADAADDFYGSGDESGDYDDDDSPHEETFLSGGQIRGAAASAVTSQPHQPARPHTAGLAKHAARSAAQAQPQAQPPQPPLVSQAGGQLRPPLPPPSSTSNRSDRRATAPVFRFTAPLKPAPAPTPMAVAEQYRPHDPQAAWYRSAGINPTAATAPPPPPQPRRATQPPEAFYGAGAFIDPFQYIPTASDASFGAPSFFAPVSIPPRNPSAAAATTPTNRRPPSATAAPKRQPQRRASGGAAAAASMLSAGISAFSPGPDLLRYFSAATGGSGNGGPVAVSVSERPRHAHASRMIGAGGGGSGAAAMLLSVPPNVVLPTTNQSMRESFTRFDNLRELRETAARERADRKRAAGVRAAELALRQAKEREDEWERRHQLAVSLAAAAREREDAAAAAIVIPPASDAVRAATTPTAAAAAAAAAASAATAQTSIKLAAAVRRRMTIDTTRSAVQTAESKGSAQPTSPSRTKPSPAATTPTANRTAPARRPASAAPAAGTLSSTIPQLSATEKAEVDATRERALNRKKVRTGGGGGSAGAALGSGGRMSEDESMNISRLRALFAGVLFPPSVGSGWLYPQRTHACTASQYHLRVAESHFYRFSVCNEFVVSGVKVLHTASDLSRLQSAREALNARYRNTSGSGARIPIGASIPVTTPTLTAARIRVAASHSLLVWVESDDETDDSSFTRVNPIVCTEYVSRHYQRRAASIVLCQLLAGDVLQCDEMPAPSVVSQLSAAGNGGIPFDTIIERNGERIFVYRTSHLIPLYRIRFAVRAAPIYFEYETKLSPFVNADSTLLVAAAKTGTAAGTAVSRTHAEDEIKRATPEPEAASPSATGAGAGALLPTLCFGRSSSILDASPQAGAAAATPPQWRALVDTLTVAIATARRSATAAGDGGAGPSAAYIRQLTHLMEAVETGTLLLPGEAAARRADRPILFPLYASRCYDPLSAEALHYRWVESQFYRLCDSSNYRITRIEHVIHSSLAVKFDAARQRIIRRHTETALSGAASGAPPFRLDDCHRTGDQFVLDPIWAFHATATKNIDSILVNGFRMPGQHVRFLHRTDHGFFGKGIYNSEYSRHAMSFLKGQQTKLLLCQVMLGRTYRLPGIIGAQALETGYDSHIIPNGMESVVFTSEQMLPVYVVTFRELPKHQRFEYESWECKELPLLPMKARTGATAAPVPDPLLPIGPPPAAPISAPARPASPTSKRTSIASAGAVRTVPLPPAPLSIVTTAAPSEQASTVTDTDSVTAPFTPTPLAAAAALAVPPPVAGGAARGGSFRVMTYNVHMSGTGSFIDSNPRTILRSLQRLNADVIVLNEVCRPPASAGGPADAITELSKQLSMPHVAFAGADSATFGNAVLSRNPFLKAAETVYLNKSAPGTSRRCMIVVPVAVPVTGTGNPTAAADAKSSADAPASRAVVICALHLDHVSETVRSSQLAVALEHINSTLLSAPTATAAGSESTPSPLVLMAGDFNSLQSTDYSTSEWSRVASVRRKKGWEAPATVVTDTLKRAGWIDPWNAVGTGSRLTAHVKQPKYRIDYVWLSPGWTPAAAATVSGAARLVPARMIVDTKSTGSDHFPVVIDFAVYRPSLPPPPPSVNATPASAVATSL